ncbi:unnamed protein product, partial [marine sediment metagenome]
MTIWVDPQTDLPVRIEVAEAGDNGASIVCSNIRFNAELDESLFSTSMPDGY